MSQISQKRLKELLNYDPVTGQFTWKLRVSGRTVIGALAGSVRSDGYRSIRLGGLPYRAHRLAFLYMEGYIPKQVDHINHIHDDNRWCNLEKSDYALNGKNHPRTIRNTTGVVGVSQRPDGRYVARIYVNKKHKFLGIFDSFSDAVAARQQANAAHNFHKNHGT